MSTHNENRRGSDRGGRRRAADHIAVIALGVAGVLGVIAFWVALFVEIADFGGADDDPRPLFVIAYSGGLILSLIVPVAADVALFRRRWWSILIAATLGGLIVLATILGVD